MEYQSSTHMPKVVVRLGAVLAAIAIPILSQPAHAQVALKGAGATFPYPIYTKWFEAYQKATGVNYQAVGSGAGIKQLQAGTVDFGASDAPLSDKDEATMPSHVIELPTVAGAVAVSYNLSGVSKLNLSGDVLADIYLGTIKTWDDPRIVAENKGTKLPSLPIVAAHRSDGSGTTFIFTNYLKAVSSNWASQVGAGKSVDWPGAAAVGGKGNDGVAAAVKATEGGIGYVELAYAHHNNLAVAAIQNKSGKYVLPSVAGAEAAESAGAAATAKDARSLIVNGSGRSVYPITGYTFLLFYANSTSTPNGKAFTGFLKWAFTTGQSYAAELDYAPLPKAVVKTNLSRLQ